MTDGIININKPAGWTSQDVCSKLRHVLHIKKIGHTGTLDPMATGVLPVCIGKATRIIQYYDRDAKSYHASMKLGITTDTLDITGEVQKTADWSHVSEKAVREAFRAYTGRVKQIPPKYSALKIDGKRAYDLARSGADFEIKPREITIFENTVTRIDLEKAEIEFDVTCSKGTYIRTICDDIGRELGCGATMTALTRTASGYFRLEDSYTIEEIVSAADAAKASDSDEDVRSRDPEITPDTRCRLENMIIPADVTLEKLGKVVLNNNRVMAFMNGNSSYAAGYRVIEPSSYDQLYRVYAVFKTGSAERNPLAVHRPSGFLGIGSIENGSLVPQKVFSHL